MDTEILTSLTRYIVDKIIKQPHRSLDPQAPLITSGLIDSFNLVDLALFIEDEYGVHIDDSELNSSFFDTLEQLVEIIQTRKK